LNADYLEYVEEELFLAGKYSPGGVMRVSVINVNCVPPHYPPIHIIGNMAAWGDNSAGLQAAEFANLLARWRFLVGNLCAAAPASILLYCMWAIAVVFF
jgi:hypothetical protein